MDYKELANLIFPDAKTISYYEEKYPERKLEEGANSKRDSLKVHRSNAYRWIISRTNSKEIS